MSRQKDPILSSPPLGGLGGWFFFVRQVYISIFKKKNFTPLPPIFFFNQVYSSSVNFRTMQRSARAPCHTGCNDMVFHQCESTYVFQDGYLSQNSYKEEAFVWHFLTMNFLMGYISRFLWRRLITLATMKWYLPRVNIHMVFLFFSQGKNLSHWIIIQCLMCTFWEKALPHLVHGSGFLHSVHSHMS